MSRIPDGTDTDTAADWCVTQATDGQPNVACLDPSAGATVLITEIDIGAPVELRPRDTVLLATDGLMDNVHLEEIIEHIRKGPADAAVDAVVELARRRMQANNNQEPSKPDDLSLIVYRKRPPARRNSRGQS